MLRHRVVSGILLGAAPVAAAYWLPDVAIWIVLMAVSALGQLEFYRLANAAGIPVYRVIGLSGGALLISATFFRLAGSPEFLGGKDLEHAVLLAMLIAVFVRQFPQKHNPRPLETMACTFMGVLYVPYLFNYFTRLAFAWGGGEGAWRVGPTGRALALYLILVVKISDVGAYFTGRACGRHKLFPRISPAKTWEGLAGGVAAGLAASLVFRAALGGRVGVLELNALHAAVLGILLPCVGVAGDLFESLLKRAASSKDSSAAIPGMGGVLDVLDSLLFSAPVLYIYARVFLR